MMNSILLKLWIKAKINSLDKIIDYVDTEKEAHQIEGKINILKEIFEDFNLESVDEKEIIYHSNI